MQDSNECKPSSASTDKQLEIAFDLEKVSLKWKWISITLGGVYLKVKDSLKKAILLIGLRKGKHKTAGKDFYCCW